MGRIVTALLMLVAAAVTLVLDTARQSFELLMSIGAGTGLIYLLRWYWWRINAWSEVAAMASSFVVSLAFFIIAKNGGTIPSHQALLATVAITTVVWVVVTYLTRPTSDDKLLSFYRLIRPAGPGWRDLRERAGPGPESDSLPQALLGWVLGCTAVYSALFGTGSVIYREWSQAAVWIALLIVSGVWLARLLPSFGSGGRGGPGAGEPVLARDAGPAGRPGG
jgi:Na+/proline symporter